MFVPSFKILLLAIPEKFLTENVVRKKVKQINKWTDKQYVADSLIHSATCNT